MESSDQFICFFCGSLSDEYGCPCELCGNDAHYGYDCPSQVPFVYNQDPCFNQNLDNFPQTSPSFPQQYLCCEDCGGPHATFQYQPINQNLVNHVGINSWFQVIQEVNQDFVSDERVITSTIKYKEVPNSSSRGRFKDFLRACPHHGFTELHQLDTFYNALTPTDQDSLNAAAGGNLLTKTPRDDLTIIENKSKAHNSRNRPVVSKVSTNAPSSSTPHFPYIAALADAVKAMLLQKSSPTAFVKAIEEICVTCGGLHPYHHFWPSVWQRFLEYRDNIQGYVFSSRQTDGTTSPSVDDEAITFKVGQTSRYSYNDAESVNRIDVIDVSCEEYAQEVLGFLDSSTSGNPTPSLDPILSTYFLSFTPFKESDFVLEEIKACLSSDSIPPGIDDADFDPKGDICLLEKLLNDDPSLSSPPKELHFEEIKMIKSSIDDPPKLELKDLPSHLEYALLEETNKLPVIIAKDLKHDEKDRLLKYVGPIFHDMIEETMEVFMDDFSVFGDSFSSCLSHLDKMALKMREREREIEVRDEVNRAKVDVMAYPPSTSIKGVQSF
ncbi:hypothetical protein Tco_0307795 [Tanacetum coccineum]